MTMLESLYSGRRTLAILATPLVMRRDDLAWLEFGDISSSNLSLVSGLDSWTRGLVCSFVRVRVRVFVMSPALVFSARPRAGPGLVVHWYDKRTRLQLAAAGACCRLQQEPRTDLQG